MRLFSSPGPKVQVSYCHHLASVVRRPSSVRPSSVCPFNFSKIFFSETAESIATKLGVIVIWGVLYRTAVRIFDSLKNMAAMAKNRT